jgi:hypothetical protein
MADSKQYVLLARRGLLNEALRGLEPNMTPAMLLDRIDRYGLHHIPFHISHMKSMFEREIRREIKHAGREHLRVLKQGSVLYA